MIRILIGVAGTMLFGIASWGGFLIAPVMASFGGIIGILLCVQWVMFGILVGAIASLHFLPMAIGRRALLDNIFCT